MSWILLSPDGVDFQIDPERFRAAVAEEWPGRFREFAPTEPMICSFSVEPDGEPVYDLELHSDGSAIGTDGQWPQAARVARWGRRLLGAGFQHRVWLIDQGYTGHVDVPLDATREQIEAGWIDHSIHGEPTDVR